MNALFSQKRLSNYMWLLGSLYLLGGCSGLVLSCLLRAGYGPSVVDQHTALLQGAIGIGLGSLAITSAWSIFRRWSVSLPLARLASLAVLGWGAWILFWAIWDNRTLGDYWIEILGGTLAAFALIASFRARADSI